MATGADLLPKSADVEMWTNEEKSVAEFIGFTTKIDNQVVVAPLGVRAAFLAAVERTGLDPVARQIYLLYLGGKWIIMVSIDGARLIAKRSGTYLGQTKQEWTDGVEHPVYMTDSNGAPVLVDGKPVVVDTRVKWVDVWTKTEPPAAARVGVLIEGASEPTYGVATWAGYARTKRDGSGMGQWGSNGSNQLSKCAEMLALRKGFPLEMSGLYAIEEMDSAVEAETADGRDWLADLKALTTETEVRNLYAELKSAGAWNRHLDAEFRSRLSEVIAKAQAAEPETVVVEEQHA